MNFDVIIVGGGPAGLAFVGSLAGTGLQIAIIEKQSEADLADPAFDGREIALTQSSMRILQNIGAWDQLSAADIAPLRQARVLNGRSPYALDFGVTDHAAPELGMLVPNHQIRAALFRGIACRPDVHLQTEVSVIAATAALGAGQVTLSNGSMLTGRLVVAADSRFSAMRGYWGIAADLHRVDAAMLVCRLDHEANHRHIATECFDHDGIVATLPLNGRRSSVVLTLPTTVVERLMAMDPEAFGRAVTLRCRNRLGTMQLASTRHVYPLVTSYARRFVGPRGALIGDAAVGMHPMTAHGFNLGLRSQDCLASMIREQVAQRRDIGAADLLSRYEHAHRQATWPLFTGTAVLAKLYTAESLVGRLARHAGLRIANNLPPFKRAVRSMLMENTAPP